MVVQSESRLEDLEGQDVNDKKQRLRQRFEVVKKLGQGTYGKVQLAINKETKREVAIKTIKKTKIENEQELVRIRREIQIMAAIQHPHIIHIYEVFENSDKIVLVMQYASGGELYDYLGCHRKLPEREARRIFRQIAAAIYYCHKNKICHRDLKLENILLDDKGNAKIADFGLSNLFDERKKLRTFCGSPLYASPEIVKGTPYCGPEVDCWSLGVLLYTLVYGAMPFDGRNFKRLVKQISEGDYFEPNVKSKASGIIRRLLTVDVTCRATIKDICLDEWVNEGYDHSLFKLANDMANLTPVSISSNHHTPSGTSIVKNPSFQTTVPSIENTPKDRSITHATPVQVDDPKERQSTIWDSASTTNSNIKDTPREIPRQPTIYDVPCEVKFVMGSILTAVERMVKKQSLLSHTTNVSNPSAVKEVNLQITEDNRYTAKKYIDTNQSVAKKMVYDSNQIEVTKKDAKKFDSSLVDGDCKEYPAVQIMNNDSEVVSADEMLQREVRDKKIDNIKTWNVSVDQSQITQKETDSILPIFNVTSIIPQRPNRRSSYNRQEKLIQNGDAKQITENAVLIKDSGQDDNPLKPSLTNGVNETSKCLQPEDTKSKHDQSEPFRSSVSKHRNDVIDFINNIFSRHKLSTQIVRHTELDTQENSNNKEVRQSENGRHNNIGDKMITQNITSTKQEAYNAVQEACQTKNETNRDIVVSSTNVETNNASTNGELPCKTIEDVDPTENSHDSQSVISHVNHELTTGTKAVDQTTNLTNEVHDEIASPANFKEPILSAETLNAKIQQHNTESINSINDDPHFSRQNPVMRSSIDASESNTEKTPHCLTRKSLRDKSMNKNNNHEEYNQTREGYPKRRLKNRSYSVGNPEKTDDLEKILKRPRKYSLCALLAASFELEQIAARQIRKDSDLSRKMPGKVEIPKSFDPSSESESQTPVDKREFILLPGISVAENKQKMENEIEKVKISALSMIMRRKSEASARRKIKKYTRSYTDVLQRMEGMNDEDFDLIQNCNPFEAENMNGSVDYLMNGNFKFGEELNLPEDYWATENFDCSHPLLLQGNESYVPIRRCCKKMTFPSKSRQNVTDTVRSEESDHESCFLNGSTDHKQIHDSDEHVKHLGNSYSLSKRLIRKKFLAQQSSADKNRNDNVSIQNDELNTEEEEEDAKSIGHSESIYSSSLDKDSSDNDDDLDEIFGSKLDARGSEDLWQYLKSVNNDLSNHLKRIKHNKSLCSRSKSQECKTSGDHRTNEKFLTRSRSKEEKQNSQSTNAVPECLGDSCYCSLASDFNHAHSNSVHCDKEHSDFSLSMKNSQSFDDEFCSTEKDIHCGIHSRFSESMKEKFCSLSNLDDTRSFLYPQNSRDKRIKEKCKSWSTVPDLDDFDEFAERNGENVNLTTEKLSLYGTMRPRHLSKSNRSQSQMILSANDHKSGSETLNRFTYKGLRDGKEHSNTMRNKALSECNINDKKLSYDSEPSQNFLGYDIDNRNSLKFSKSLGSRLNLEPLNYSSETLSKSAHKTKPSDYKKRTRKVSFLDVSKAKNPNFGIESVAKAQKVLNSIDRNVEVNIPEDTGTLLEALKTQGYKYLISQRLQESEAAEVQATRRYSWAGMRNGANYLPDSLSALTAGSGNTDLADYAKYILWNRKMMSIADDLKYESDMNDDDLNIYGDPSLLSSVYYNSNYPKLDASSRTLPNMWLYQNMSDFRPTCTNLDDLPLQDWEDSTSYSPYNETYDYNMPDFTMDRYIPNNTESSSSKTRQSITKRDQNRLTSHEAGLQSNTPSTIEKLSKKIKALKHRCSQKSFEDLSDNKDQHMESAPNKDVEQNGASSSSDPNDNQDDGESVSDRIWRKSFYSRFNDVSTSRRRRSTLMESDFSLDSLTAKPVKRDFNVDHRNDELKLKYSEKNNLPSMERTTRNHVMEKDLQTDNEISITTGNEQNIPHPISLKTQIEQVEDR